jgi:hypothetical protein
MRSVCCANCSDMAAAERCRVNDGGDATAGSAALVLPLELPLADDLPLALPLPEADCDCAVVDAVWWAPRNRSAKHAKTSVWTNGVRSLKRRSSALHSCRKHKGWINGRRMKRAWSERAISVR